MTHESQFKPLPERQREICVRLSAIRRFERINQAELANKVGVTRNQIANIEAARVPLRAGLALSICKALRINPRWLAEGVGSPNIIDDSIFRLLAKCDSPDSLYSAFYDRSLKPSFLKLESFWREEGEKLKQDVPVILEKIKSGDFSRAPNAMEGLGKLVEAMLELKTLQESVKKTTEGVNKIMAHSFVLTEASSEDKSLNVKSPLASLRARLNKQTAQPGKKSELADFLGAPLESVSRWLSGAREPGGDVALKMLLWVERQERKQ